MESPLLYSPVQSTHSGPPSRSRSSTKVADDITSLTSFNPFSEDDENDQSSYALVSSLFSRMKSSFSAPLNSSAATPASNAQQGALNNDQRRPSASALHNINTSLSSRSSAEQRPTSLKVVSAIPAPPLVSLTPVVFEAPSLGHHSDHFPSRGGQYTPFYESPDGAVIGTAIPGFPIQDDARSIRTSASLNRSASVSKVIRRIRGEGLSRDYWMDDENAKECYDCKSVFTTWRRKHHCRICGQIFCSRCASNIIKGSRFGHDGMVRVCNLCLEKLAKVEDDDDDDRRSVVSSTTSAFPAHQFGTDSFTLSLGHHPQSPFAASQLFGRTDGPFNLYSIAETKRPISISEDSAFGSPQEWEPVRDVTAPFRRNLVEDEKDPAALHQQQNQACPTPTTAPRAKTPIDFPITVPVDVEQPTTSTIQFPLSSPEHGPGPDSPMTYEAMRSRFNSFGDFDGATPFIRSRVQSRLDSFPTLEGWRTRRDSTAYAQELNLISMFHLRIMLRQMLTTERIPDIKEWEETLLKLALRIARELTFTAVPYHQGEDMDVRRYVKIKKIPGGAPSDSEYVDGAVITKNVSHKQMLTSQRNPRIMHVTFPLEFHRVEGQYVHFGQVWRQEKEYLGNLVSRIAALRPHVVMVEKSVSGIALEALAKHNIAVARAVKPSAIARILGHCARFRVQTFDHSLIPGRRKTYMRFEGCNRDMGCTIILRGGDFETFLTFIVRNLKLETHLWKDSVITLPSLTLEAVPANLARQHHQMEGASDTNGIGSLGLASVSLEKGDLLAIGDGTEEDLPDADAERLRLSKRIQQSIEAYYKTFISVSATLRFPPPRPILQMKELDEELMQVQRAWEDDLVRREESGHIHKLKAIEKAPSGSPTPENEPVTAAAPSTMTNDAEHVKAQIEALPTPDLPRTPSPEVGAHLQVDVPKSYFEPQPNSSGHILFGSSFVVSPNPINITGLLDAEPVPVKTIADIALESKLSLVKYRHDEQRRIWEWYLRKNADDFVVEKYQCIGLWRYTVPIDEFGLRRACFAPVLRYISFYGENDCTLGQFIEKQVNETLVQFLDPKAVCAGKGCNQPLARHCQVFVHNETRLAVAVEQWDGQIKARNIYPSPDMIITWSACRVCGSATPFIPVSEEMQRYSFAKFLELHFYPADVQLVQGAGCQHNIYQHHIRYFATRGMTVRFQADPVTLHEIVYPAMRIRISPEAQLELKNADFERLHRRNTTWYTALVDDLKLISIDAATGEEEHDTKLTAEINALIARAEAERLEIAQLINNVYKESSSMDTLALNQVRSFRQDRIVAWQADFDKLPKPRNTQSSRRVSAFSSVRAMWPKRYDLSSPFGDSQMASASVSEAEDGGLSRRRVTGESLVSSASEVSETELETHLETPAEKEMPLRSDEEVYIAPPVELSSPAAKSDPDSDSTIGASKEDGVLSDQAGRSHQTTQAEQSEPERQPPPRASRLPRRPTQHPNFIPATGVEELAKTAFSPVHPPVSESDQEDFTTTLSKVNSPRPLLREPTKKPSTSDFESGYAANAAPRFKRSSGGQGQYATRATSRRTSPDKKGSRTLGEPSSPPQSGKPLPGPSGGRTLRRKVSSRGLGREKPPSRPTRPPQGAGTKRIGRENERASRRYAVIIRGRKALLDSIKDAIRDESDISDSSSEADDEGGDEYEGRKPTESSPEQSVTLPAATVEENTDVTPVPVPIHEEEAPVPPTSTPPLPPPIVDLESSRPFPPSPFLSSAPPEKNPPPTPPTPPTISLDELPRNSIFRQALQGLWLPQLPSRRAEFDYEDPLNDPEHIFRDSSMVVRTDEPTSIIALALNSSLYRDMLAKSRAEKRTIREPKLTEGEAFMPDDKSVAESSSTWGVVNVDASDSVNPMDELKSPSTKMSWVFSFESGGLTISCTILYPEQFDALRRTYDCEKSIIESLSRCVTWNANGGKSGSAFLKTREAELQTMETFAPAYFDYMASAVTGNRPTLLAKVFGCYKLTFKKTKEQGSSKAKVTHMNLLVMENLFHNRRLVKIYDLKGSTRNRHVQSTGRENEVLLDENLVETAHLSPFYLKEHSKRILRGALYNDSKFLADINVMDYSLVAGIDNETHEIVVGIIDYIRTYTWDKKLESWVKESAFLGGGGKGEPTIVGPKQYRQRFISAMERYFPLVPDRWMKQKDASEEDPDGLADLWPDW
ncbi:hypothetical protein BU15DRAFT_85418 [Melanogaster broomeanus]|nr:hypothetical protein BU15DRAFT_85418 [Melanogaster broomeanus]